MKHFSLYLFSVILLLTCCLAQWPGTTHAITNGSNDVDSFEANVVVRMVGNNGSLCTGTLISPVAVLTAKHCITGDNFSGQNPITGSGGGNSPLTLPITVYLGNPLGTARAVYYSIGAPSVYGNNGPLNDNEKGADVAIVWLNPSPWATTSSNAPFELAFISRPDLASPVPSDGDDSEGGDYNVPIGMSGWSPSSNHDPKYRQVAYYSEVYHYPGYPGAGTGTASGQYWVHAQGAGNLEGGDSGGPLFWKKPDGTRQVLGVASATQSGIPLDGFDCFFNKCDIWTDVTRGVIGNWVREQMVDTSRSTAWLKAHGRTVHWKGEVDYTGPCNQYRQPADLDCDHWYNEHDTCPNDYNPDQREGVRCPLPPAPNTPPQNCRAEIQCGDVVTFRCDAIGATGILQRLDSGDWHTVGTVDPALGRFLSPSISDYAGPVSSVTYRVCSKNAGGQICTNSFSVTPNHNPCGAPSPGGTGGPNGGGRTCGAFPLPKCHKINIQ